MSFIAHFSLFIVAKVDQYIPRVFLFEYDSLLDLQIKIDYICFESYAVLVPTETL